MIKLEKEEEQQLISKLKNYKVKPLSMKYLKTLKISKESKSKQRNMKMKFKEKVVQPA